MEYAGEVKGRELGGSVFTVPYTLTYKPLESHQVAADGLGPAIEEFARDIGRGLAADSAAQAVIHCRRHAAPGGGTIRPATPRDDPARVAELIAALAKSGGISKASLLDELARLAIAPQHQNAASETFLKFVKSGSTFERRAAIRGLDKWAAAEHLEAMAPLLGELSDLDWTERTAMIRVLSRFESPIAYRAIAARLASQHEQDAAREAIIQFGAKAETAVGELLSHASAVARRAAAQVLGEIGADESLPALNAALAKEQDAATQEAMRTANRQISSR